MCGAVGPQEQIKNPLICGKTQTQTLNYGQEAKFCFHSHLFEDYIDMNFLNIVFVVCK